MYGSFHGASRRCRNWRGPSVERNIRVIRASGRVRGGESSPACTLDSLAVSVTAGPWADSADAALSRRVRDSGWTRPPARTRQTGREDSVMTPSTRRPRGGRCPPARSGGVAIFHGGEIPNAGADQLPPPPSRKPTQTTVNSVGTQCQEVTHPGRLPSPPQHLPTGDWW